jgi:ribosomal protein S18 acetylase RimI-like enzyme
MPRWSRGASVRRRLLDGRIQASILANSVRWRESVRVGPFTATFDRDEDNRYLNYAVPDAAATPSSDDVAELVAAYRARGRVPRLEYIPQLAPAVEAVLLVAGFQVEGRLPLMTCARAEDVRRTSAEVIELVAPASEEEYRAAVSAQSEAYGEQGPPAQHAVDSLRRTVAAGGVAVLARDSETGEAAGAGWCTAPEDGLTELTSVGVRPAFRRRGVAAAMTGWLAEQAFAAGMAGVFLMAAGRAEARIYERAGFADQAEVLHISST